MGTKTFVHSQNECLAQKWPFLPRNMLPWAALLIEHLPTLLSTKMALNMKDFQGERMTKYDQSHRMVFFVGASLLRSLAAG